VVERAAPSRRPLDAEAAQTAPLAHPVGRVNLAHKVTPPTRLGRRTFQWTNLNTGQVVGLAASEAVGGVDE